MIASHYRKDGAILLHALSATGGPQLVQSFAGAAEPPRVLRWLPNVTAAGAVGDPSILALGRDNVVRVWHPSAQAIEVRARNRSLRSPAREPHGGAGHYFSWMGAAGLRWPIDVCAQLGAGGRGGPEQSDGRDAHQRRPTDLCGHQQPRPGAAAEHARGWRERARTGRGRGRRRIDGERRRRPDGEGGRAVGRPRATHGGRWVPPKRPRRRRTDRADARARLHGRRRWRARRRRPRPRPVDHGTGTGVARAPASFHAWALADRVAPCAPPPRDQAWPPAATDLAEARQAVLSKEFGQLVSTEPPFLGIVRWGPHPRPIAPRRVDAELYHRLGG